MQVCDASFSAMFAVAHFVQICMMCEEKERESWGGGGT
jgi:hypothetical protein